MDYIISFENITKKFGGTTALSNVSFNIKRGEVHCLCGENGAGKSTLMNICGGVIQPTSGVIRINGQETKITSVSHSEKLGFSIVHQEVPLCLNMSIAHNIFLNSSKSTKGIFLDEKFMEQETEKLLKEFKLNRKPSELVGDLSIAEQSIVQIAKAVYFKPKILIMDEPTAALTNDQREVMFEIIQKLKKEIGTTIIYISHRLEEIMEIGDTITVLRDGQFVKTISVSDITVDELVSLMVGREITNENVISYNTGENLLTVKNLTRKGEFENISFELNKGEILGLGGFVGAGRSEVLMSIFGFNKPDSGEIFIEGKPVEIKSPSDAIKQGIALIPENRRDDALIEPMSIKQNAQVVILKDLVKGILIDKKLSNDKMDEMVEKYKIKANNVNLPILTLSGGNQQKVIIARWISNNPKILFCDEPTRGIDVGAKAEVYAILRSIAKQGIGIIVVSSELPELLALSDRILVMHEGRMTGQLMREEATEEKFMRLAAAVD